MSTVYPISGHGVGDENTNPAAPSQPYYGSQVGTYPAPSTGYAQGYYLPPGAASPGQPGQFFASPSPGQPVYSPHNPSMTAYPAPQAYAGAPPTSQSYPGFSNPQPYADPYGAAPRPVDGTHPASNPQCLTPNLAYSTPVPSGGAHPAVVYPMTVANEGTSASSNPANDCTMRAWSVGLFDCFHHCIPNLFMVWCCPCVSLAQIYARLGISTYWTALVRFTLLVLSGAVVRFVPMGSRSSRYKRYASVFTSSPTVSATSPSSTAQPLTGTVWYAFLLAQQVVLVATIAFARRRTRQRFQIPGSVCIDAITACLCPCCTIAQVATHIRSYTPGSCEFTGPKNVLPPFQG